MLTLPGVNVKVHIVKDGEVTVHQQLREQIIFRISTGELAVGQVMPSVRQLERQLKIHRNTISQVYAELVHERWLAKHENRRLVVIRQGIQSRTFKEDDLDALIDRVLAVAHASRISVPQLAARLLEHALDAPPDHLLVVEPESAMGEVMKYEIRKATGRSADAYPVHELRRHPALLAGALLLVPSYLFDLLDFVPAKQRASAVSLCYSPFDTYLEHVRSLEKPSLVGMMSVSAPGLRTMTGEIADSIGTRHQLCHFWLEWPPKRPGEISIRRLTSRLLPPDRPVRVWGSDSGDEPAKSADTHTDMYSALPTATVADLVAMDVLLCDSIAYDAIEHRNRVKYQMLSPESLRDIGALKL